MKDNKRLKNDDSFDFSGWAAFAVIVLFIFFIGSAFGYLGSKTKLIDNVCKKTSKEVCEEVKLALNPVSKSKSSNDNEGDDDLLILSAGILYSSGAL